MIGVKAKKKKKKKCAAKSSEARKMAARRKRKLVRMCKHITACCLYRRQLYTL